jgi:hypothetical protein
MAYRAVRTVTTLDGLCQLLLTVRRCHNRACERYRQPCRPEEEGRWALPHGEFGLDIIALIGTQRYERHDSVPEIHQTLCKRGVVVRGAVRVVASVATRLHHFCAADLQPTDVVRWYTLRDELETRQQLRRAQFRFRRAPDAYLATLEHNLLQLSLPP